jgi:hypothetical protein
MFEAKGKKVQAVGFLGTYFPALVRIRDLLLYILVCFLRLESKDGT